VYRQYDHQVQINTVLLPGADAAVLRIKGQERGLALTLDGNSLYAHLHPRTGGAIAVAEACRNLACVGAKPIGVTNCLNFGNPEKSEVMWQFKEVIEGMAQACRVFCIPVTGGNVSFYNETEGVSVYPTPVLGVVGLMEDVKQAVSPGFKSAGDVVVLLGENREELGGSEYLRTIFNLEKGRPPRLDLQEEKNIQELCLEAISRGIVRSAHDASEGGLAVAAAECSLWSGAGLGCILDLNDGIRTDALAFGESQSRILVTARPSDLPALLRLARKKKVKAAAVGKARGRKLIIRHSGAEIINLSRESLEHAWKNAIPEAFAVR
jgi:phosphoribosylformylglycinamidine (FGAM) synthase-like enzyme